MIPFDHIPRHEGEDKKQLTTTIYKSLDDWLESLSATTRAGKTDYINEALFRYKQDHDRAAAA